MNSQREDKGMSGNMEREACADARAVLNAVIAAGLETSANRAAAERIIALALLGWENMGRHAANAEHAEDLRPSLDCPRCGEAGCVVQIHPDCNGPPQGATWTCKTNWRWQDAGDR